MSESLITKLKRLQKEATKGLWEYNGHSWVQSMHWENRKPQKCVATHIEYCLKSGAHSISVDNDPDLALIAAMHTALPALLRIAEKAQEPLFYAEELGRNPVFRCRWCDAYVDALFREINHEWYLAEKIQHKDGCMIIAIEQEVK